MFIWSDPHNDPLGGYSPHFTMRRLSSHGFPENPHSQESSLWVSLTQSPSSLTKASSFRNVTSLTQELALRAKTWLGKEVISHYTCTLVLNY